MKDANSIDSHRNEIAQLIPEVEIMFGFDQQHRAHQHDLWLHSCHTVVSLSRYLDDGELYLDGLLHDIGKPYCQSRVSGENKGGIRYIDHSAKGMEIVRDCVIPAIYSGGVTVSDEDIKRLSFYIGSHDDYFNLKSHLDKVSLVELKNLILLQIADAGSHIQLPAVKRRLLLCRRLLGELELLGEKGV